MKRETTWPPFNQTEQRAWNEWWDPLTRKGDPERRPYLTAEAFLAGYAAGRAPLPASALGAQGDSPEHREHIKTDHLASTLGDSGHATAEHKDGLEASPQGPPPQSGETKP